MAEIKVLLVEDEVNFGSVLSQFLKLNDFDVQWVKNGKEAWSLIKTGQAYDCCVLDVMMPEMDGIALGKEIKRLRPDLPFVYLTAKSLKEDMIEGFNVGADDYITKPFDSEILVLKLKAMLQRHPADQEVTMYSFGSFEFDPALRTLKIAGQTKRLSPKEAGILQVLVHRMNQVVEREAIMNALWDEDNYFNRRSMDVYMSKLRKHLSSDPRVVLMSLHAGGYRLTVS